MLISGNTSKAPGDITKGISTNMDGASPLLLAFLEICRCFFLDDYSCKGCWDEKQRPGKTAENVELVNV